MAVESKKCFNHGERSAELLCHQCHKPLCKECVWSTTEGGFCNAECARKAREFQRNYQPTAKPSGLGQLVKKVIFVVVALIILLVAVKIAAGKGVPWAKKINTFISNIL